MVLMSHFHFLSGTPPSGIGSKFGFILPEKYSSVEKIKKVFIAEGCMMETNTQVLGI